MEKKVYLITILLTVLLIVSCDQDVVDPLKDKGSIFVDSNPELAAIYIDGKNTGKFTPAEVEVVAGIHHGTLKKAGYANYNFVDTVTIGRESSLTNIQMYKYGVLDIKSDPEGAKIYIDGENTGDKTPMFYAKADSKYLVTLRYDKYRDTTFQTEIVNARDVELEVNLKPLFITVYSSKILYDTTNSAANEPSGLNLETGNLLSIDQTSSQSKLVDLFFAPNGFGGYEIKTPNGTNGMFRNTVFKVSKETDINDGENSPLEDPTWRSSFPADTDNYIFAYDSDGHFSKIKVVRILENPTRAELQWIYNDNPFDTSF